MSRARSIQDWFAEYGESHRNETNQLIHWLCVPTIYFSVVGLLCSLPDPPVPYLGRNLFVILPLIAVLVFYMPKSLTLGLGMGLWTGFCVLLARWLDAHAPWPLWMICVFLFVLAWVGQFYGHKIEGRKPSFLKDFVFLLVGPGWLMAKLFKLLRIPY